jgi:hypothetical protein
MRACFRGLTGLMCLTLFQFGNAAVSGHRSWASLKPYTHLRERRDKYEIWKWKAIAIEKN